MVKVEALLDCIFGRNSVSVRLEEEVIGMNGRGRGRVRLLRSFHIECGWKVRYKGYWYGSEGRRRRLFISVDG
jgi:hypothetical protein